ncbi:MAG TPA: hypothetical protein VNO70_23425 [Blastocatellia bacterium]|nr:hypothetical protein [Blastocatellia bacterium]
MKRRTFFFSLASFPALFAQPPVALQASAPKGGEALAVSDEIKALEAYVQAHPTPFPWDAHNELRHLYIPISEAKSFEHADIILANSLMDDYMLDILSDWQLGQDPGRAVIGLLSKAEKYPYLLNLRAACLVKAGDVCREHDIAEEAKTLYQSVVELADAHGQSAPALNQYKWLARFRLGS